MHKLPGPLYLSRPQQGLQGSLSVPGDKSISHRALMIASLTAGRTNIYGVLEGEDVMNTADAMRAMGVSLNRFEHSMHGNLWEVDGLGVGGLTEPRDVLDMGNSGTGARLIAAILASNKFVSVLTGDDSLRARPMNRVIDPLCQNGAQFKSPEGVGFPLIVLGTGEPLPIVYECPVASAQVKSAILLAGLHSRGVTEVYEPIATRDHTERMLKYFGANLQTRSVPGKPGAVNITLEGPSELKPCDIIVPGDPSSAAFLIVASLLCDGSNLTIYNVGLNSYRVGLYDVLKEMGAKLDIKNLRLEGGEEVGDISVKYSKLRGVTVAAECAPSMIDEYPILAVAAASADGDTRMEGLGELRVKESDRFSAIVEGLNACGVRTSVDQDTLIVHGRGGFIAGDAVIDVHLDHRMAMSFLVLGLIASKNIAIDDGSAINTSYPGFIADMEALGVISSIESNLFNG